MVYPDSEVVTTTYNTQGLPSSLTGDDSYVSSTTFNVMGQVTQVALGNSVTAQFTFDPLNFRLDQIDADSLLDLSYAYDYGGNVTTITDTVNSSQVQSLGYDALDRLVSASTSSAGLGQYSRRYSYDEIGNISSRSALSGTTWVTNTYSYTDTAHVHAVTGVSNGWEFTYDAIHGLTASTKDGNMTYRDDGTAYTQTFDLRNQLVAVTDTTTLSDTVFVYDGDGNRVKVVYPDNTTVVYVGDHYEVEGSTTRSYYFFNGRRVALRVQDGANDDVYWFHQDHLGSTSSLSDESGDLVPGSTTRYYPYGEYRTAPTQELTDVGFTGHLHEDQVSLVFMRARCYVSSVGRFSSADSIVPDPANPQDLNRYTYVRNSPLTYTDPSGHCIPGVDCPGNQGEDYIWDGVITVGGRSADEFGEAYQYQGSGTNDCGPTSLAMLINLQFSEAGIDFEVSGQELGEAMLDASRGIGLRGFRLLWPSGIRGATPPWGMTTAYDRFNSELVNAGYPLLGQMAYHYGGTKDELLDNLNNGVFSTLVLVWKGGAAHYATVVGYDTNTDEFLLLDPGRGGDRSGKPSEDRLYRETWESLSTPWSRDAWYFRFRSRVIIETHTEGF